MITQIEEIKNLFLKELKLIKKSEEIKELEVLILGKKGKLNGILKSLKDLTIEEKKSFGIKANELKKIIKDELQKKIIEIEKINYEEIENNEKIDVTIGFPSKNTGHKNPISTATKIIEDIFISMGYKIEDGPEIENEEYNFSKLNIPDNHPARDVWDTFWLSDQINNKKEVGEKLLLRTHTSPVQIRKMLKGELPIKIIIPGRVFRYEKEDARHISNFYQMEGLVVGEGVTFGDLKWTLNNLMKKLFGENTNLRFRPSIFPFTEPSAEIDMTCSLCKGKGGTCKMCSGVGWLEILGAGMVHPKVLENCGIDSEKYSGFAFGMGIDRVASQLFNLSSARLPYQSNLKYNEQF